MKGFNIFLVLFLILVSCKGQDPQPKDIDKTNASEDYTQYGAEINTNAVINTSEMTEKYRLLKANDSVAAKFSGKVKEVCQSKGCWMKLELEDGGQAMVRFKDYGFFMPLDLAGKEVIVNGLAFVEEMSVEDQRHYAKDAGKSKDEIAKITDAKKTYGFEADGVLVKKVN